MIEFKDCYIDGKKYIDIHEKIYSIKENPVGVREKFWIVRRGGNLIVESPSVTDILFKYNRNDVSCEDSGEVISSRFYRRIGLKAVEYYFARYYKEDGTFVDGVMCGSFKKHRDEIETSAYTLQTSYTPFYFDKETGEANKQINTVYGIMSDLEYLSEGNSLLTEMLPSIKSVLTKQCLLDFVFAQTDRHWLNTSFLEYFAHGNYLIKTAKCYDNGCIAYLKRKKQALVTIMNQVKGDYINSPRMEELMDKYCPMFGLKTTTVVIDVDRYNKVQNPQKLKLKDPRKARQIFVDELTDEILVNANTAVFYKDLLKTLNYNPKNKSIDPSYLFDEIGIADKEIDPVIQEMVTAVVTYQINEIEKTLEKKLDIERKSRLEEEREYYEKN